MSQNVQLVFDNATGDLVMVVKPDSDDQLKDPAFNPPYHTVTTLPLKDFNILDRFGMMQKALENVAAKDKAVATLIADKISAENARRLGITPAPARGSKP